MLTSKIDFQLSRLDGGIALCMAGIAFALYARTLYPGLLPGDSGEFQTLAALLAHTHPTGYDVYLLLAKIFIAHPGAGSIAYRVNLFSAFMAGLTVGGVYLAGTLLSGAALGRACLGRLRWRFGHFLVAGGDCGGLYRRELLSDPDPLVHAPVGPEQTGTLPGAGGSPGVLSLGVHLTVALAAPAVVVYLLLSWKDWRRMWKPVLTGFLTGAVLFCWDFPADRPQYTVLKAISIPPSVQVYRLWKMTPADVDSPWERLTWQYKVPQFRAVHVPGCQNHHAQAGAAVLEGAAG